MKKIIFLFLFSSMSICANAQYKKASFLNKKGRTYDLGLTSRILGGGNSAALGFSFSYGKERSAKRLFHWWDLDFVLGNKYNYATTSQVYTSTPPALIPVQVSGKTGNSIAWRYNLAFFVLDNGNEVNKILPFVDLSVGVIFGLKTTTDFTVSPNSTGTLSKQLLGENGGYSAGIGAGAIYRINEGFGIKLNAAYNGILGIEKAANNVNRDLFITLPNHVSVSIGAHWLLNRDND
jgi:hypothetical protein